MWATTTQKNIHILADDDDEDDADEEDDAVHVVAMSSVSSMSSMSPLPSLGIEGNVADVATWALALVEEASRKCVRGEEEVRPKRKDVDDEGNDGDINDLAISVVNRRRRPRDVCLCRRRRRRNVVVGARRS